MSFGLRSLPGASAGPTVQAVHNRDKHDLDAVLAVLVVLDDDVAAVLRGLFGRTAAVLGFVQVKSREPIFVVALKNVTKSVVCEAL